MSSLSIQDEHLGPEDHPYELSQQAPASWLERLWAQTSLSLAAIQSPENSNAAVSSGAVDSRLEDAVYGSLRQPREPSVISEPAGFFRELDRRIALISVAGRFAAAIGVSAAVALFFVFMVPAPHDDVAQTDGPPSGIIQSMKAALNEPSAGSEDGKPALCELQNILGTPQAQPAMSKAQSETLLQQFMQWREKPVVARTP